MKSEHFSNGCFCTGTWVKWVCIWFLWEPFLSSLKPWDPLALKARYWGAYLLGAGLNSWDAHCCDHTPCSSGEALGFEFLPNHGLLCPGWGLWQAYDSPSLALMWFSSHLPDVQTLLNRFLDFFFLAEEIIPFVAVDWVCPLGGGEFMTFLQLLPDPDSFSKFWICCNSLSLKVKLLLRNLISLLCFLCKLPA